MKLQSAAFWPRALVCLLLLLGSSCARDPSDPPKPREAGATATPARPAAVVTARTGKVELQHGPGGGWSDAQIGDRLDSSDSLRTGNGQVDLALDGVRMRLHEASRLRLSQSSVHALRAKVRGRVESEVEPERGSVELEVEGSDAIARSEGGHFFVTAEGRGVVAVAAVSGSVRLAAGRGSVVVRQGEVSRIAPGGEPEVPTQALKRVMLAVRWPEEQETNKESAPIAGKVQTGSRVFVQGEPVDVAADGAFVTQVPLREGRQKVAVVVVDPLGRSTSAESTIVRDQSPPDVKVRKKLWR